MGFEAIIGLVTSIIGRIWPDKTEAQKLQFAKDLQQAMLDAQLATGQMDINKAEAESSNMFVAGARPFIMWICGFSFMWQFLLQPLITYFFVLSGNPAPALPIFDYGALNTVLMGMLGLGALRSYEKVKGVAR